MVIIRSILWHIVRLLLLQSSTKRTQLPTILFDMPLNSAPVIALWTTAASMSEWEWQLFPPLGQFITCRVSHQLIFRYYANAPKCWKASTVTFHRKENPMIQKLPDVYWLLTRQMLSTFPRKPFWECSHRHNLFYSFGHHQFYCQQPQPGHLGPHWGQVFQRLINIFQRQSSPLNCCIFLFELNAPVNLPLYDSLLSAFLT